MRSSAIQSDYTDTGYPYSTKTTKNTQDQDFSRAVDQAQNREAAETQSSVNEQTALTYQEMLSEHIQSIREKLLSGNTEEKIQVGGEAMTIDEWNLLLEGFDAVQEEMLETMRARHAKQALIQEEQAEMAKLLTEDYHAHLKEQEELLEDELLEDELEAAERAN